MIRSWRCMVCLRDSKNICGVGDVKSVKRQWKTPEGRLVLDICCRSPGIVHTIRNITISFTFLLTQATLAEIVLASGCGWMSVQRRWLSGFLDILKFALEKWPWFILYNVNKKDIPVCVSVLWYPLCLCLPEGSQLCWSCRTSRKRCTYHLETTGLWRWETSVEMGNQQAGWQHGGSNVCFFVSKQRK